MRLSGSLLVALALAPGVSEARVIKRADPRLTFEYRWPAISPPLPRLEARLAAAGAQRLAGREAVAGFVG